MQRYIGNLPITPVMPSQVGVMLELHRDLVFVMTTTNNMRLDKAVLFELTDDPWLLCWFQSLFFDNNDKLFWVPLGVVTEERVYDLQPSFRPLRPAPTHVPSEWSHHE